MVWGLGYILHIWVLGPFESEPFSIRQPDPPSFRKARRADCMGVVGDPFYIPHERSL